LPTADQHNKMEMKVDKISNQTYSQHNKMVDEIRLMARDVNTKPKWIG